MAKSDTEIANQALVLAGASKLLTDLVTDRSPEAGQLRVLLPQRRDELLEAFGWHFATKRAPLAELEGATRTDWLYVYALPGDLLTARAVVLPGVRYPRPEDAVPYKLEAGDPGDDAEGNPDPEPDATVLLCDLVDAELLYTARCTKPTRFSSLFTAALAWRLAIDAALYLTKKDALANVAQRNFPGAFEAAKVHSASQAKADQPDAPDFLEGYQSVAPRFKTALE